MNKLTISNKFLIKSIFAIFVISLLILFMTGCSNNTYVQNEPTSLKKISLVLDYTPNTNHLGIYVAKDKGWFEKYGLDVDIKQPPEDGADSLVASGKAQFGISFQDWMANYLGSDKPLPVTAVAAIVQHNTSSILSRADSNIDNFANMTNKTYGSYGVEIENEILKNLVNSQGGNWDEVNIVLNSSTDEYQGLSSNAFDCIWSYDAWGVEMCKLKGLDVNAISLAKTNPIFDYYTPLLIANNDYLNNNEQDAKSLLKALKEGYEFTIDNPDEAADILLKYDKTLNSDLVHASAQILKDEFKKDTNTWGIIDKDRWSRFYNWLNENNLTEKPLDINSGFTNYYLDK